MPPGVLRLRKVIGATCALAVASLGFVSCGSSSKKTNLSGLPYRAFVTNPLYRGAPAVAIINAQNDTLDGEAISLQGTITQPSQMLLSPSRQYSLIYSPAANNFAYVNNTTEAVATGSGSITLPGFTESFVIASDNSTGYTAVPSATVIGTQIPGAVIVMNLLQGSILATLPVPSAHYVFITPDGSEVLTFSDNTNTITLISPVLVGSNSDPRTFVNTPGFDHPVFALFSSDSSTAYVLNCGPECGGTSASIAVFDLNTLTVTASIPLPAATTALINGTTMYVAGSAPGTPCGSGTAATACGTLSVVNLTSLTANTPLQITNGFHNHMELTADGQLFIGAKTCSDVNIAGGEVRGCLSIFDTTNSTTIIPTETGDVTGIAPIPGRQAVYVVQGAIIYIYDTQTDQLEVQTEPTPLVVTGQPYDVKYVDTGIPQ